MCLFALFLLLQSVEIFCLFLDWVISFPIFESFIYSECKSFVRDVICKYFLPMSRDIFSVLCRAKVFNIDEVQFIINFFLLKIMLWISKRSLPNPKSRIFSLVSSRSSIGLHFTFRTMILFGVNFCIRCGVRGLFAFFCLANTC